MREQTIAKATFALVSPHDVLTFGILQEFLRVPPVLLMISSRCPQVFLMWLVPFGVDLGVKSTALLYIGFLLIFATL